MCYRQCDGSMCKYHGFFFIPIVPLTSIMWSARLFVLLVAMCEYLCGVLVFLEMRILRFCVENMLHAPALYLFPLTQITNDSAK